MLKQKYKKCKVCNKLFRTFNSFITTCSSDCTKKLDRKILEKSNNVIKPSETLAGQKKLTQEVFNTYIRLRDKELPCISCGKLEVKQWHAGHFISVGSNSSIRFEENNVHKQCSRCNVFLSGNYKGYRENLLKKIGAEMVNWLEGYHPVRKYTIEDMKEMRKLYRNKIKLLKEV